MENVLKYLESELEELENEFCVTEYSSEINRALKKEISFILKLVKQEIKEEEIV